MANLRKFAGADVVKMLRHYSRAAEHPANKDINPDRTELNYSLTPGIDLDDMTSKEVYEYEYLRYQTLLDGCKHINRADVKTMCTWVIDAPAEVVQENDPELTRRFFSECVWFLQDRYGNNCICAEVHLDETTPHMHYAFMPIVNDPDGSRRLCAKEVINRAELQRFHRDLDYYINEDCGIKCKLYTGKTKAQGGNRTIEQLKQATLAEYAATADRSQEQLIEYKNEVKIKTRMIDNAVNRELQLRDNTIAGLRAELAEANRTIDQLRQEVYDMNLKQVTMDLTHLANETNVDGPAPSGVENFEKAVNTISRISGELSSIAAKTKKPTMDVVNNVTKTITDNVTINM